MNNSLTLALHTFSHICRWCDTLIYCTAWAKRSAHHPWMDRAPFPSCTPHVQCGLPLLPVYQGSVVQRVNQFSSLKWHESDNSSACIVSLGNFICLWLFSCGDKRNGVDNVCGWRWEKGWMKFGEQNPSHLSELLICLPFVLTPWNNSLKTTAGFLVVLGLVWGFFSEFKELCHPSESATKFWIPVIMIDLNR